MMIATVGAGIAGRYLAKLLLQRGIFPDATRRGITTIAAVVAPAGGAGFNWRKNRRPPPDIDEHR